VTPKVYHAHSTGLSTDARRPDTLAVLDAVERRLATIQTVEEAKELRDQAEAVRMYAHRDLLSESPRTKRRYVWEQKWTVAAEFIATFAGPGAFVVDPMAGTGTSGEAALHVGCRWLGVEQDPAGVAHAAARLRALEAGAPR
jgi:hypothetical protein